MTIDNVITMVGLCILCGVFLWWLIAALDNTLGSGDVPFKPTPPPPMPPVKPPRKSCGNCCSCKCGGE